MMTLAEIMAAEMASPGGFNPRADARRLGKHPALGAGYGTPAAESIFDWRPWAGGEMPVPPGTLIDVEYRNGSGRAAVAGESGAGWWAHDSDEHDIMRYRLRNPLTAPKHSHYFKPCPYDSVDVYRVLQLFAVIDPCLQHAVKKLLVAGGRGGGKPIDKDVQEAIDTLVRWQAMRTEESVS
jgi:hypothetical protein